MVNTAFAISQLNLSTKLAWLAATPHLPSNLRAHGFAPSASTHHVSHATPARSRTAAVSRSARSSDTCPILTGSLEISLTLPPGITSPPPHLSVSPCLGSRGAAQCSLVGKSTHAKEGFIGSTVGVSGSVCFSRCHHRHRHRHQSHWALEAWKRASRDSPWITMSALTEPTTSSGAPAAGAADMRVADNLSRFCL